MDDAERKVSDRDPDTTTGSADPGPDRRPAEPEALDDDLVSQAGTVPNLDARDVGDSGAPPRALGAQESDEPGLAAAYQGDAGGSDVRAAGARERGSDLAEGEERPPG